MIKFVTSLNQSLYQKYGRRFIEGWASCAGHGVCLVVYAEGGCDWISADVLSQNENIIVRSIETVDYDEFRRKFGRFAEANGRRLVRAGQDGLGAKLVYDYRFDAIRFCFKAFSYHAELKEDLLGYSHLAWIDADMVCKRQFSFADLTQFLPDSDVVASYLGRSSFPPQRPHSECGFIGFNLAATASFDFLSEFVHEYISGKIFLNSEWHDSYIFDVIRRRFEGRGHKFLNLSGQFECEEHPFVKTDLGLFFDHLKGPIRKQQGHS